MSKHRWAELMVAIVIVAGLVYLFRPPQVFYEPASKRSLCRNNLKQFGLALHLYHERYHSLPPAFVIGSDGKRWHSWRALILPFMEIPDIAQKYRFDEPWDGPNNRQLWNQCPEVYRCPTNDSDTTKTHYLAVTGPGTLWPDNSVGSLESVKDRANRSVSLMEVKEGVPWLAPADLKVEEAIALWKDDQTVPQCNHPTGSHVLNADGTVSALSPYEISREEWAALLSGESDDTDQNSHSVTPPR